MSNTAATGVPIYTIRGIGFSDYSTSASSTVGVYSDEIALPYAVMTRGVFSTLDRSKCLKGPQAISMAGNSHCRADQRQFGAPHQHAGSRRFGGRFPTGVKPVWKALSAGLWLKD